MGLCQARKEEKKNRSQEGVAFQPSCKASQIGLTRIFWWFPLNVAQFTPSNHQLILSMIILDSFLANSKQTDFFFPRTSFRVLPKLALGHCLVLLELGVSPFCCELALLEVKGFQREIFWLVERETCPWPGRISHQPEAQGNQGKDQRMGP